MKKRVEFSSIEPTLKAQFRLLMAKPEEFNIEGEDAQHIKDLSSFAKRAGWKIVKQNAKLALAKQNDEELASSIIEDLQEDGVKIVSKRVLEILLEHPENPDFQLDDEMIGHIKSLKHGEIVTLKEAIAHKLNIDEPEATSKSIGQKILDSFRSLWDSLAPIFSSLVIKLADLAGDMAHKAIDKHLSGEFGQTLAISVDKAIDSTGLELAALMKKGVKEEGKEREEEKEKSPLSKKLIQKVKLVEQLVDIIPTKTTVESLAPTKATVEVPTTPVLTDIASAPVIGEVEHHD